QYCCHTQPISETSVVGKKQSHRQYYHRLMAQCLPDRHVFDMRFVPSFFFQFGNEPTPFVRSQPSDFLRPVRKDEERCNSQNERRKSFQQKEPAPTGEIQPMNAENFSGNRTSDDETDRDRGHESRNGCGTVL